MPEAQALSPVKRALLEVRELRARLQGFEERSTEPVAVIGLGLRFPGASDPDAFWELLRDGREAIREVPAERWDVDAFYDPEPETPGRMYARHGGFLDGVDKFDPDLFGISPREAQSMDPQQRILLEVAWETLEHAGVAPDGLGGSATGVFLGLAGSDYSRLVFSDPARVDVYAASGTAFSVAAGRLSYLLGLQGPSLAVDTACSSSLTAVHLAVQSLRSGECRLALAGGVNLILLPEVHINFCHARMLAADGRCKTFDAAADGYVRGEGCGLVALKRLSDARADGDDVLAVIRGSALNQDGRSSGLTAPSGPAQEAVLRAALASARLEPGDVDYVEAHGTGTSLGDPIEVQALGAVFGARARPLRIGAVKTNVGHLEAAAGIAGLVKVILSLGHGQIPPHLHLEELNPHVDWGALPLEVPTKLTPWARNDRPRVGGVSSFGFSGTNAHILVEEAPEVESPARKAERPLQLLTVSAASENALRSSARRLADHLGGHPEQPLGDVALTLNAGRARLRHRLALVAGTREEARSLLATAGEGRPSPVLIRGRAAVRPPEVVYLFTGQGAQQAGMGRQLFDHEPVFRREIEGCDEILGSVLDRPLLSVLYPKDGEPTLIHETAYTQPALFALQYALARLWRSWGIEPAAVLGHSAGELAAACVAGVFSREDGLRLAAERGRLMQELPVVGGMATVFADEALVAEAIAPYSDRLWIAGVNSTDNVVISGTEEALTSTLAALEARGVKGTRLLIGNAFHSPLVEPMLDALEAAAGKVEHGEPRVDLVTNLTGEIASTGTLGPAYWRHHVREPVLFHSSIRTLASAGHRVFVEMGPHPTLLGIAQGTLGAEATCLPSLRRDADDWKTILESLGTLSVLGAPVAWATFHQGRGHAKVRLPTYAFERQRYWIDGPPAPPRTPGRPADAAVDAAREQSQQGPLDLTISSFPSKWAVLDRLTIRYQIAALRRLGAFSRPGERSSASELRSRLGIGDTYEHLVLRWLEALSEEGHLRRDGDQFISDAPLPDPGLPEVLAEAEAAFADYPELLGYVIRCGDQLESVLTGRVSPLETLFPGGSFAEAEGLYERSCVARYLNRIVGAAVGAACRERDGQVTLLEIGAGTGGTTSSVLERLPAGRTSYAFTDVSDAFLAHARRKLGAYGFVDYRSLDIERDPEEQGFDLGTFDVVVAANVLHATRDLRATMARVRSLLAPGGVLVLNETTAHPRYCDITTGLIEGWQIFDDDLRRDNPIVSAGEWFDLLGASGFEGVAVLPGDDAPTRVLGNHVIVAGVCGTAPERHAPALAVASDGDSSPADVVDEPRAVAEALASAMPSERLELLRQLVRRGVMAILRLDEGRRPDLGARLIDLGLDSLMAVQLRNELTTTLGLGTPLPATLVFDHPTCAAIAAYLDQEMFAGTAPAGGEPGVARQPASETDAGALATTLESMSDEETEELLLKRLQSLEGGE